MPPYLFYGRRLLWKDIFGIKNIPKSVKEYEQYNHYDTHSYPDSNIVYYTKYTLQSKDVYLVSFPEVCVTMHRPIFEGARLVKLMFNLDSVNEYCTDHKYECKSVSFSEFQVHMLKFSDVERNNVLLNDFVEWCNTKFDAVLTKHKLPPITSKNASEFEIDEDNPSHDVFVGVDLGPCPYGKSLDDYQKSVPSEIKTEFTRVLGDKCEVFVVPCQYGDSDSDGVSVKSSLSELSLSD